MSWNTLLLVLAGVLGLIALGLIFRDGIREGLGYNSFFGRETIMSPAQVSVILKVAGGLFFAVLLVLGSTWIYNQLNDNEINSEGCWAKRQSLNAEIEMISEMDWPKLATLYQLPTSNLIQDAFDHQEYWRNEVMMSLRKEIPLCD